MQLSIRLAYCGESITKATDNYTVREGYVDELRVFFLTKWTSVTLGEGLPSFNFDHDIYLNFKINVRNKLSVKLLTVTDI